MLVVVVAICLARGTILGTSALPLSLSTINNSTPPSNSGGSDKRSILDIIWSCFATTFACTWVAIHPNIPSQRSGKSELRMIRKRLKLMIYFLLAPEMMIIWALRQWRGARKLAEKYKDHGWTQTEGHFLQMGGFQILEENGQRRALSPERLQELHEAGRIDFPAVSLQDIEDKSKGDAFAKAVAVFQTLWFIAQVIARGAQGLVITELEIVTLAFAAVNGVMYYLWWFKPLDVRAPYRVHMKLESEKILLEAEDQEAKRDSAAGELVDNATLSVLPKKSGLEDVPIANEASPSETHNGGHTTEDNTLSKTGVQGIPVGLSETNSKPIQRDNPNKQSEDAQPENASQPRSECKLSLTKTPGSELQVEVEQIHPLRRTWARVLSWPFILFGYIIQFFLRVLYDLAMMLGDNAVNEADEEMPEFYACGAGYEDTHGALLLIAIVGIAIGFGGIHCIAWNFEFPTNAERILWRTSALSITCLPFVILVGQMLLGVAGDSTAWEQIAMVITSGGMLLYFATRIALLLEACVALRVLSPGAFASVEWTTFFPHV